MLRRRFGEVTTCADAGSVFELPIMYGVWFTQRGRIPDQAPILERKPRGPAKA